MKKILTFALALALFSGAGLAIVGCSKDDDKKNSIINGGTTEPDGFSLVGLWQQGDGGIMVQFRFYDNGNYMYTRGEYTPGGSSSNIDVGSYGTYTYENGALAAIATNRYDKESNAWPELPASTAVANVRLAIYDNTHITLTWEGNSSSQSYAYNLLKVSDQL
jgi:hypothetical protein